MPIIGPVGESKISQTLLGLKDIEERRKSRKSGDKAARRNAAIDAALGATQAVNDTGSTLGNLLSRIADRKQRQELQAREHDLTRDVSSKDRESREDIAQLRLDAAREERAASQDFQHRSRMLAQVLGAQLDAGAGPLELELAEWEETVRQSNLTPSEAAAGKQDIIRRHFQNTFSGGPLEPTRPSAASPGLPNDGSIIPAVPPPIGVTGSPPPLGRDRAPGTFPDSALLAALNSLREELEQPGGEGGGALAQPFQLSRGTITDRSALQGATDEEALLSALKLSMRTRPESQASVLQEIAALRGGLNVDPDHKLFQAVVRRAQGLPVEKSFFDKLIGRPLKDKARTGAQALDLERLAKILAERAGLPFGGYLRADGTTNNSGLFFLGHRIEELGSPAGSSAEITEAALQALARELGLVP